MKDSRSVAAGQKAAKFLCSSTADKSNYVLKSIRRHLSKRCFQLGRTFCPQKPKESAQWDYSCFGCSLGMPSAEGTPGRAQAAAFPLDGICCHGIMALAGRDRTSRQHSPSPGICHVLHSKATSEVSFNRREWVAGAVSLSTAALQAAMPVCHPEAPRSRPAGHHPQPLLGGTSASSSHTAFLPEALTAPAPGIYILSDTAVPCSHPCCTRSALCPRVMWHWDMQHWICLGKLQFCTC